MSIESLLEGRLLLVTGKGGTGKSTVAAALAILGAVRGRRVLLAELDMSRPATTAFFGREITAVPQEVQPRLDVVNILYRPSLEHFVGSIIPVRRIVRRVIENPIIDRFLDFTPGAREMVTLSRLIQYARDYDLVVVDLPASGHAFSLLDVTRSALGLFKSGPMRKRAADIRTVLEASTTRLALVALPEEMVINETIETHQRFADYGLLSRPPVVLLNRSTQPTLSAAEQTLIDRLQHVELDPLSTEFVRAGGWEAQLEQETTTALERLKDVADPVLVPPATNGGLPEQILRSVVVDLGRHVGVTRRMLPPLDLHPPPPVDDREHGRLSSGELNRWLDQNHLVITVGSGGVGKTTSAAALGLYAARRGRRVMVLTIDPARRLANSLGLSEIGNEQTQIDLSRWSDAKGELWAMMLDSRSTMDALIARIAEPEVAARIFKNHVYRHMADTFAGSQDYMATEKLYDLVVSERYDLIVLDTPPVKNALDFLESPGRLLNFMDETVLQWFLAPYEGSRWGMMWGTSAVIHRLLKHLFGEAFLEDLAVFFTDFQGLYDGFRARHEKVVEVLHSERTSFVTICAPTQSSLDVASYFVEELGLRGLPRGGVVVNQVHRCAFTDHNAGRLQGVAEALATDLPATVVPRVLARLGMSHRRLRSLVDAETVMISRLRDEASGGGFYQEVPRLPGQVHDLDALHEVGAAIFKDAVQL